MNILLGITGGIAAYKSLDIISGLIATNHVVKTVVTQEALNFVTKQSLAVISKNKVNDSMLEESGEVTHIELSKWCDVFIIVPATANTIGKIANGFADNLLTTITLAVDDSKIKIICPAMNCKMYENKIVKENIEKLKLNNWNVIEPIAGKLACGDEGIGKLNKPRKIVEEINRIIN